MKIITEIQIVKKNKGNKKKRKEWKTQREQ